MTRFPKIVALAAGAASATGFAPLGLWPVTLIAFAVLIALIHAAPIGRAALLRGWSFGVGHFALGLNWIAHAFDFQDAMPHWLGYVAVVLLSLYLAVYPAAAAWLAWRAGAGKAVGRGSLTLAFAAAWIATEYCRATFFTGFAWNPLGVIWVGTEADALSACVGTYGLSGLTMLACGLLLSLVVHLSHEVRGKPLTPLRVAALIAFFVLPEVLAITVLPYVLTSSPPAVREVGPLIRVVQPNLSLAQQRDGDADEANVARMERLSGVPTAAPRLILWPEGAVPYYLDEEGFARTRLAKVLGPRDVLLTGGSMLVYNGRGDLTAARNSVFAIDAASNIVARYDKTHLVPYGEYLPIRPILSAIGLARLVESDVDFIPGTGSLTTTLPGFGRVGVQICYEIIFSGEVVDRAARPRFIFNPSIDAWFGAWGPPQHLAQARLRAIEEGLPVVRSTSTGISAVIDSQGKVRAALPLDRAGFIATRLPAPDAPTLFAKHGNAIPLALAVLLAALAIAPRFRRR